jgi:hypothetical protein
MKYLIAGSRDLQITSTQLRVILEILKIRISSKDTIVAGGCPTGPDEAARALSLIQGIPYKEFPANWEEYGKAAGPIRNNEMAQYADVLILIWDGQSRGSSNMRYNMKQFDKPIYEIIIKKER